MEHYALKRVCHTDTCNNFLEWIARVPAYKEQVSSKQPLFVCKREIFVMVWGSLFVQKLLNDVSQFWDENTVVFLRMIWSAQFLGIKSDVVTLTKALITFSN